MKTDPPLVSIVTPVLNGAAHLARCLDSVTAQSYSPIEHIVVDGGSTDGTLDILRQRDHVDWTSEPDDGQSDAINKGFGRSHGEILGWLNADDYLTPYAIESVVQALARGGAGWTIGDVMILDRGRKTVKSPADPARPMTWAAGNVAVQPGSFFASWALEKVGPLDPSFHYMMDMDLWLRLIDAGISHEYIPEVLAVFEVHADSKSGSVSHASFLVEEGRVRLKSGRLRTAAFAFGRAAAWRCLIDRNDPSALQLEMKSISADLGEAWARLPRDLVEAGARCEATIIAVKREGWRALPRLADPKLWVARESRARMVGLARRQLTARRRNRQAEKSRPA